MNRIALAPNDVSTSASSICITNSPDLTTKSRRFADGQADLPYATFAPMHYEARYAYPLLVWLHGNASSEQELRQVMPLVSMRNYVAIAPRGPSGADSPVCRQTGLSAPRRYEWHQTADAIECAESQIADCIAAAEQRFNIHPRRIFLVGRDSGGTMAIRAAWSNPNRFAGAVAINAPLPSQFRPLRHVNELRSLPCLLATSRDAAAYPESHLCQDLRLLHVAGCKVMIRHYPLADGLTDIMLSDLNGWLMDRVCGNSMVQEARSRE